MPQKGSLIAQAYTGRMAIPLEGVSVTITVNDVENPEIIAYRITDINGKTEPVEIETPDMVYSQAPSDIMPFAVCSVQFDHPLYYSVLVKDVQVFAETESIQQMEMVPLEEFPSEDEKGRIYVVSAQDL